MMTCCLCACSPPPTLSHQVINGSPAEHFWRIGGSDGAATAGAAAGRFDTIARYHAGGQQAVTESDIIGQVTSLFDLQRPQTTDKGAQAASMQPELAWLQTRPGSIAQQQAIASLKQSIDQLTKSTDSLNATNQELLSPYYTQDPRTSHIGFRSQGMAAGGYVDVPGGYRANDNMLATIPVASGERIYVDPMTGRRGSGGGNLTINISPR